VNDFIKIKLDKGAIAPSRAHPWDGGLDLYAKEGVLIPGRQSEYTDNSVIIDTGVHLEIPENWVGLIRSRSGLMCNHSIVTDGTIDAHYTGSIKVKLINHSLEDYLVSAGDKIAQLVIVPCLLPRLELVDSLEETDRGANGFGSTGR
jgi:dUTP pyrophosphatase